MAFRDSTGATAAANSVTVSAPAISPGDIVVLAASGDAASPTITFPAGFGTPITQSVATPDGQTLSVAMKVAGTEPATYAVTMSTATDMAVWCASWSGRGSTTATATKGTSTVTNTSPITVTNAGLTALLGDDVFWVSTLDTTAVATVSNAVPTNYTRRQDISANLFSNICLATRDSVSA